MRIISVSGQSNVRVTYLDNREKVGHLIPWFSVILTAQEFVSLSKDKLKNIKFMKQFCRERKAGVNAGSVRVDQTQFFQRKKEERAFYVSQVSEQLGENLCNNNRKRALTIANHMFQAA